MRLATASTLAAGVARPAARDAAPAEERRRTRPASGRTLDLTVMLDVEDVFSPPEVGADDSIKELADILTEEGLPAAFLYIGDRAEQLRERGRRDVIDSMAFHEVGLHTRSARHPTSPEYVAGKSWDEAVAEALRHEREGAAVIRDVFDKPCVALSGHATFDTPHNQRAGAILGLPYVYPYPAAPPLYSFTWYAGALGLPFDSPTLHGRPIRAYFDGFDDRYPDTAAFEAHLARLDEWIEACLEEGQPYLNLFVYHPQKVRLADYIDLFWSPNGINYPREQWGRWGEPPRRTPQQVRTALDNFRRLVRWVRRDPRLNVMTTAEVARKYGQQPAVITRDELLAEARAIADASDVLIHPRFSPAELTVGMAQALASAADTGELPASVPRREVLGPLRNPIRHPELLGCPHGTLVRLARKVVDRTAATGHLPAVLGPPLDRVGVNHLYRGFAQALVAHDEGSRAADAAFTTMPAWPEIAVPLAKAFLDMVSGPLMDPGLDVQTLYRDVRLQTWTLKPAIMP